MNNSINIKGQITTDFIFSHNTHDEDFYQFYMEVERLSSAVDILPVIISENAINNKYCIGSYVNINGQIRSHNSYIEDENRYKLVISTFARDINSIDKGDDNIDNVNEVILNGFICKQPTYRTTPFGREITDILLAINRPHNRSDYIPCIIWGRNANMAKHLNIGDNVQCCGRLQSRTYQKKLNNNETIDKVAYEVSLSSIELAKQ